jgi:preprotein translocase subunit SecE
MANPVQFLQQVRQEAGRVSWPSRRETLITTAMVLAFVAMTSLFFVGVDRLIAWGISHLLGFGR